MDIIIIIVVAIPLVTGLFKGLIRMVFGLLGLFGGVVLSIVFTRPLGVFLGELMGVSDLFIGKMLAFVLIFIGCGVVGMLGGWLVRKMIETANLGFADRLMGGVLGAVQGVLTAGFLITICYLMPVARPVLDKSMIASKISSTTINSAQYLPETWVEYLSPTRWVGQSRAQILKVLNDTAPKKAENKSEDTAETKIEDE